MGEHLYWLIAAIIVDGMIVGINILEIILLVKYLRSGTKPVEVLILSLCVADLLCGLVAFIEDSIQLGSMLKINTFNETTIAAYLFDSLFTFSLLLSILHITSIALNKLIAEVAPEVHTRLNTQGMRVLNVVGVWVLSITAAPAMSILPTLSATHADSAVQRVYGSVFTTSCVLVCTLYTLLFATLLKREKHARERMLKELLPGEMRAALRDRRNTYTSLLLGISFVLCVFPYSLGLLDEHLYHPLWNVVVSLNHLLNPVVYFFRSLLDQRQKENDKKFLIMEEVEMGSEMSTAPVSDVHF